MIKICLSMLVMLLILISIPFCIVSGEMNASETPNYTVPVNESTPDYHISAVKLPAGTRWIESGKNISPTIMVVNEGSDDAGEETMTVSAYLGSYPLIPKSNIIPSLTGGESREITLEFILPEGIPPRDYQFFVSLDNSTVPGEADRSLAGTTAPGLLTVKKSASKVRSSGCGCS